jgi:hypothetical protein
MLEAHAITKLDYFREDKYDEMTLMKVHTSLCEAGVSEELATKAMNVMLDKGILFRERKHP